MNKLLKIALGLVLLLVPVSGIAQNSAQRWNVAVWPYSPSNSFAQVIPNAKIYVCQYNAQLSCNTPNQTIYSDPSLSAGSIITQPLTANIGGVYSYFVQYGTRVVEKVCGTYSQCSYYDVYVGTSNVGSININGTVCTVGGSCTIIGTALQTNSVNNSSQLLLNFLDTATVKFTNPSGGIESASVPPATNSSLGAAQCDGTTTTCNVGIVSAITGTTGLLSPPSVYSGVSSEACNGAVDNTGRAWIILNNGQIIIVTKAGGITTLSPANSTNGNNCQTQGAFDASGNFWYGVNCGLNLCVNEISPAGTEIFSFTAATSDGVQGMTMDHTGNIWISDLSGVQVFSQAGALLQTISPAISYAGQLFVDSTGVIWELTWNGSALDRISASTYAILSTLNPTTTMKELAFDSSGNGWLLSSQYVQEINSNGSAVLVTYNRNSQYFNGSFRQRIAVDSNNNIWLTGESPTNNAYTVVMNPSGYILMAYITDNFSTNAVLTSGTTVWVASLNIGRVTIFTTSLSALPSQSGVSTNLLGPVNIGPVGTATSLSNEPSNTFSWTASYYSVTAISDLWVAYVNLGTGTTPTSTLTFYHVGSSGTAAVSFPIIISGGGTNIVYRCATAGALPAGALTITAANCGTTADTNLRVP